MTEGVTRLSAKQPDVPLPLAMLAAGGIAALFVWLKNPRATEVAVARLARFADMNSVPLTSVAALVFADFLWISFSLKTKSKLGREAMPPKSDESEGGTPFRISVIATAMVSVLSTGVLGWYIAQHALALRGIGLLPFHITSGQWAFVFGAISAIAGAGGFLTVRAGWRLLVPHIPMFRRLPQPKAIQDGIILGAIHEEPAPGQTGARSSPEWLYQGLRGLTGNLFLSGAIGSGKSQILLRVLKQLLSYLSAVPSLLAIDPKRTFVRELRKIIEAQGKADRLLWVSLDGAVKFNPIWREGMLRRSQFTAIANSLKLASVNFLGSSSENRFWEQSSFNLLKYSLIYCAAKYDYFTFRELYRALVLARDEGLGSELADCLKTKKWDAEETGNIELAIEYFRDEFSQMDQKIRTSILATATGFLNEFLEYRVSQILSPDQKDITLPSINQAVADGKFILLYIENDSLARSIGTLFKLLYQEAVLERVNQAADTASRYAIMVMDEYQDVATSGGGAGLGDDRYLAKARESKAITIAATQSVSSLENAIRSEPATREILQNFRTRIFGNSTDPKTIRLFQEPHGQVDRERQSHSLSESAQNARPDLLFGGYDSDKTSRSESVSTHYTQEFPVTAREFSRLRPFEAFAQVFDGVETRFEKLFMKPYFLKDMRTSHKKILAQLRQAAQVKRVRRSAAAALITAWIISAGSARADVLFPNACSVIRSSEFNSCLGFNVGACVCGGLIPHPCAQISYYVPQTFMEVWPNSKDTFFGQHPAGAQLKAHLSKTLLPFGVEDDNATFDFQARSIAVPLANPVFGTLACGGARSDMPCFDLMSEDLGSHWSTGFADSLQPQFLAWSLAPKACLLKGAAEGLAGAGTPAMGGGAGGCSYPLPLPKYPPSSRDACNGWGVFFPRYGVYHGASRAGAALMIAARLKSIGTEVSHTVPTDSDELWQMLYPQSSSCFREGQNIGVLENLKGVREEQRLLGKPNGYLFVVWKKVSCCQEIPQAPATAMEIEALRLACQAAPGGGV